MLKAAAQRSRQLAPGDKLGKYEVIRQIAIGGMAELYLARTVGIEGFEKLVVIKRILPQFVSNQQFVTMFLNEARIAATLHHPNVAQVYDIGLDEGDYFFAMEYVHGEDLDHIASASEEQGVPISMDASLTLIAGLCAGLHYAHDKATAEGRPLQIVHRDVSPSNVLVSYDGAVKLVDFGIARAASRSGTTNNSHGGLKGKINYMSPEQCIAKAQLDRRSDIYAVGTLLYELTTGQLPFSGETEYQVLNQIVNADAPPPSQVVPGYPLALERIVLRALARNPEQRYSTALELQGAVEDFAHDTRLRVSPLVLARLMGTLFPARLEEWDHAKAQGAFFVEQHVVRTLIESGKTPDRSDPAMAAAIAAAHARQEAAVRAAERAARASDDDDTTAVSPPVENDFLTTPQTASGLTDLGGDTSVGAPPIHTRTGTNPFVEPTPPPLPDAPTGPSATVRSSQPRMATPTRPSQPAVARPSQPAIARPSQPSIARPSQPAIARPSQPAITRPSQPQMAQPSQPQMAQPSQPQMTQPSQPQMAQPAIARPSQPASTRPSQPQMAQPSQPQMTTPARPSQSALPQLLANTGTVLAPATPQHGTNAIVEPAPGTIDVTEQVRVPKRRRGPSPTTLIHTGVHSRKKPLLFVIGGLALAGGLAAFIALRGGHKQLATGAPKQPAAAQGPEDLAPTQVERPTEPPSNVDEESAEETAAAPAEAEPTRIEPAATAEPELAETTEPKTGEPTTGEPTTGEPTEAKAAKTVEPSVAKTAKSVEPRGAKTAEPKVAPQPKAAKIVEPKSAAKTEQAVAKKPVAKAVEKKPVKPVAKKPAKPKSEPKKEPTWNADSPFMPVRTNN